MPGLHQPVRSPSILVVDDEAAITSFLRMGLARAGYEVTVAADGPQALAVCDSGHVDLVVLDLMLPGMDGVEVCQRLRGNPDLLVLMLTAADAVTQRIRGLDAGADDYLVKPFDFEELLARIRALLRRRLPEQQLLLSAGPYVLDDTAMTVTNDGEPVELTRREYDLFKLFLRHPRQAARSPQVQRSGRRFRIGDRGVGGQRLADCYCRDPGSILTAASVDPGRLAASAFASGGGKAAAWTLGRKGDK